MKSAGFVATLLLLLSSFAHARNIITRPPMGWNSWNALHCDSAFNEQTIVEIVDAIIEKGLDRVGYNYVNLDDCWMKKGQNASVPDGRDARDGYGRLQADENRFPHGMAALGNYIHSKGLKFGLYQDTGEKTCMGYPGSYGHEAIDAETFAEWGVDYLKLDGCNIMIGELEERYSKWSEMLRRTTRPIVFSCSWPAYDNPERPELFPYERISNICDLWRNYGDISDNWESLKSILTFWADNAEVLSNVNKRGGYNDPDMLEVGNVGFSPEEGRTQMSVWAIWAAPLIMGHDLRKATADELVTLLNEEVIAVDQDRAQNKAHLARHTESLDVWYRVLANGSIAVAAVNKKDIPALVGILWEDLGFSPFDRLYVRDLWGHVNLGVYRGYVDKVLDAHDVFMVMLTPFVPKGHLRIRGIPTQAYDEYIDE